MKYILLFVLLFQMTNTFGQIENAAAIDSIFSKWNTQNSPGCALGIIKDHKFIYTKGYGLANMEYNIPNSMNSVFRIASTSKQFTAACIILLVQEGRLNLDDNLKSIFPDFPKYAEKIAIRHLLNHTSGVRDYLQLAYLTGLHDDDYYTDQDIMNWLINQSDLNFTPGEEHLYSNSGYWLLGQIVNKVSGMNMAEYAKKKIFDPLDMKHTHFHNDHKKIVKNRASGYAPIDDNEYKISMTTLEMIGDGGIFTTVNDIKKWDDAFYQSNILNADFWKMMTEQGVLNNGEVIDYAAGLEIGNYEGLKTVRHAGSFVGFNAELLRFPEQKITIVVFANTDNFYAAMIANQVADIVLKENIKKEEQESTAEVQNKSFINLSAKELEKFCGYYWNERSSNQRKIYLKNNSLWYFRNEYSESELLPVGKSKFKMMNVFTDVYVEFDDNDKRNMSVTTAGRRPTILKAFTPKSYAKEELSKFIGNYYSKELNVNYSLVLEDDALILYINNEKKSALKSIMENLFSNNEYGTLEFNEDANGSVIGFSLASGRVKNLKFTKK